MSEVGREVRRRREERGWSQPKLAVEAGMAVSAVSQIETGKRRPSANSLEKLAGALEVEVRDLFPLEQPRLPDVPPVKAYFVPPEEGEEPDTVTLQFYYVRLLEERDQLLQKVRRLEREKAEAMKQLEKAAR